MHTRFINAVSVVNAASVMTAVSAAVLLHASIGFASPFERANTLQNAPATCNCKNASDCTCPKGKCTCRGCGLHSAPRSTMLESLKGSTQTTRLPNTARVEDARGGVLL